MYMCIYVCLYLDFDTAIEWLNGRASVFGTEGCGFEVRFDYTFVPVRTNTFANFHNIHPITSFHQQNNLQTYIFNHSVTHLTAIISPFHHFTINDSPLSISTKTHILLHTIKVKSSQGYFTIPQLTPSNSWQTYN